MLEEIDEDVLKKTVGMTRDEIYQDEEDEFEYDNLAVSDQLYFKSARNRLKKIRELKEEAEKLQKTSIASFYGKKVMKDDYSLWDGWMDRGDGYVQNVERRHSSSDDFRVDYKSV